MTNVGLVSPDAVAHGMAAFLLFEIHFFRDLVPLTAVLTSLIGGNLGIITTAGRIEVSSVRSWPEAGNGGTWRNNAAWHGAKSDGGNQEREWLFHNMDVSVVVKCWR